MDEQEVDKILDEGAHAKQHESEEWEHVIVEGVVSHLVSHTMMTLLNTAGVSPAMRDEILQSVSRRLAQPL